MSEAVKVMVRCRPMNAKEKERGKSCLRQTVSASLKSTPRTTRSTSQRKTQKSLPKPSLSIASSGSIPPKAPFTSKAHLLLLSQYSTATTAPSSPMARPAVEKLTPWWAVTTLRKAEESFLELLVRSSPSPKATQARPTWFDAVSSKSTTKKFTTSWARISRLGWTSRRVLTRESSWKTWPRSMSTPLKKWNITWKSASKTEPPEPPTWMLSHPGPTPFSPSISILKNTMIRATKNTRLPNSTWSTWQVLKELQRLEPLVKAWRKLRRSIFHWVL